MPRICSRCGVDLPQGAKVCTNCGAKVQSYGGAVRCSHCHRRVDSELTLCPHCGRKVKPWRPQRPIFVGLASILIVAWLVFANGWSLVTRAGGRLAALLPEPLTPSPTEVTVADLPSRTPVVVVVEDAADTPLPPPTELPAAMPTPTATPLPTVTPTLAVASASPTAASSPESAPESALTATPSPAATALPSATPTTELSATPVPTSTATPIPTATSTPAPTATPTSIPPTSTPTSAATVVTAGDDTYIVRPGDTLVAIAARVGRSAEAIAAYNNIQDPTALHVNQKLRIPPADYTPPPPPTRAPRTATPVPTQPPAATPTPGMSVQAPVLTNPGDTTPFKGDSALIELKWQNPDGLPAGIENVVHIGVLVGADTFDWRMQQPVGAATSLFVPAWLFGQAPQEFGRAYSWYVQAAAVTRDGDGNVTQISPVSPPSAQRRFYWN